MDSTFAHLTGAPFLVAIAGGTGSGKTTLAQAIADRLGRHRVALLPQDSYYRDHSDLSQGARATLNYDVPEAFDRPLFLRHLRALRSGLAIRVPVYSFASHTRTVQTRLTHPQPIVIVEGLLLLVDPKIRGLFDFKIFVDAPERVRFQRRLRRDITERGRAAISVLTQFFTTVQPAHEQYVEPTKVFADLVLLNTGQRAECVETAVGALTSCLVQRRGGEAAHRLTALGVSGELR